MPLPSSTDGRYVDARWWRESHGEDIHEAVVSVVNRIRDQQRYRKDAHLRHARLYGNMPILGFGLSSYTRFSSVTTTRLSLNVVKNMCSAATAKITKSRPKPMFLTSGGDYSLKLRAKRLTKFLEGKFYELDLYSLGPKIFLDACIFGNGALKIYETNGDIHVERVFPWELIVDDGEAQYGEPRSIYQRKFFDRSVLAESFPEHREAILNAGRATDEDMIGYDSTADQILVLEAWHLPSSKDATDGRHVIAINAPDGTLLDEKWTSDYFPIVSIRWTPSPMGWWGIGLAEELTGLQLEINKLLRNIQKAQDLLGKSHWMVENSSKVNVAHIDNDIGSILKYTGPVPPQVYVPGAVAPEIYQHLWNLYNKVYEIAGISQLSAQSQKPAGLNSGVALDTYNDIETERFLVVGREYEAFFMNIAKQFVELGRRIAEDNPDYAVKAKGSNKHQFEWIKWKDVDLKEDEYQMQCWPVSQLASTPAARLQQVQDMTQGGLLTQAEAKRLLDFPDLDRIADLETASHDLVEELIEKMIDTGQYESPEPFQDLNDAKVTTQLAYLRAKLDGVPEENLELLRRFVADADALQNSAPPPAPPGAPPGGSPPEALQGPPPGPPPMPPNGVPQPMAA